MIDSLKVWNNLISWVHEDEPSVSPLTTTHKTETTEYPGFSAKDLQPLRYEEEAPATRVLDCEESEALDIQVTSVSALFERM